MRNRGNYITTFPGQSHFGFDEPATIALDTLWIAFLSDLADGPLKGPVLSDKKCKKGLVDAEQSQNRSRDSSRTARRERWSAARRETHRIRERPGARARPPVGLKNARWRRIGARPADALVASIGNLWGPALARPMLHSLFAAAISQSAVDFAHLQGLVAHAVEAGDPAGARRAARTLFNAYLTSVLDAEKAERLRQVHHESRRRGSAWKSRLSIDTRTPSPPGTRSKLVGQNRAITVLDAVSRQPPSPLSRGPNAVVYEIPRRPCSRQKASRRVAARRGADPSSQETRARSTNAGYFQPFADHDGCVTSTQTKSDRKH
jgi:hypothetical protein